MSGYRRFVAYVYEYQKGKKGSNCGFIKVEVRDQRCSMEVHLHCSGLTPQVECKIYGFVRKDGLMNGILLGSCETEEDTAECLIETDSLNMGGSGVSLGRMGGMVLVTDLGGFFGTEWDDQPIRPENFREIKVPAETKSQTPVNGSPVNEKSVNARTESGKKESERFDSAESETNTAAEPDEKASKSDIDNEESKQDIQGTEIEPEEEEFSDDDEATVPKEPAEAVTYEADSGTYIEDKTREENTSDENIAYEKYKALKENAPQEETYAEFEGDAAEEEDYIESEGDAAEEEDYIESEENAAEEEDYIESEENAANKEERVESEGNAANKEERVESGGNATMEEDDVEAEEKDYIVGNGAVEAKKVYAEYNGEPETKKDYADYSGEAGTGKDYTDYGVKSGTDESIADNIGEGRRQRRFKDPLRSSIPENSNVYSLKSAPRPRPGQGITPRPDQSALPRAAQGTTQPTNNGRGSGAMRRRVSFGEPFTPFSDGELVRCWKIQPQDFAYFPRRESALRNNRFLLYGYYNFGHLLLGKKPNGQYILGVPGGYDQQERFMANMFGFPYFKESRLIELPKARGGYWYRLINAPDFH